MTDQTEQTEEQNNAIDEDVLKGYEEQEQQEQQEAKEGEHYPAESEPVFDEEIASLTGQLVHGVATGIAPAWQVSEDEAMAVGVGTAMVLEKRIPNAKKYMTAEFILATTLIGIVVPRLMKGVPLKEKQTEPEPEQNQGENVKYDSPED